MEDNKIKIIEYTSKACPKCKQLELMLKDYNVNVEKIDTSTDEGFKDAINNGVLSLPTLIMNVKGKEVNRMVGNNPERLRRFMTKSLD